MRQRLNNTPEQWDLVPRMTNRKVDRENGSIEVALRYDDYDFDSRIVVTAKGKAVEIAVWLDKPVIIQGDGSSLWTLTWNEDFARGFIGLLGNPKAIGEAFQIMSDEQLSWTQIYECVANALHVMVKPYYVASEFLAAVALILSSKSQTLNLTHGVTRLLPCRKRQKIN